MRDCVSAYLDDPSPAIRMEAAQTCVKFLLPPGEPVPKRGAAAGLICQVIEKLLGVAVGDPDGQIRLVVLNLFDSRFDYFLCQVRPLTLSQRSRAALPGRGRQPHAHPRPCRVHGPCHQQRRQEHSA